MSNSKTFGHMSARPKRPSSALSSSSSLGASVYASTVISMDTDDEDFDEEPLNDQQWILQRKKIGLSRRTNRSLRKVNQSESKKNNLASFLQSFKRKECVRFVMDPNSKGRPLASGKGPSEKACFCGAPKDEHKTRAALKLEQNKHMVSETIMEEDETSSLASSTAPIIASHDSTNNKATEKKRAPLFVVSPSGPDVTINNESLKDIHDMVDKELRDFPSNMYTPTTQVWSDVHDVAEFPTNAFGLIDFVNEDFSAETPADYVRVSDMTPMSKIQTLLVDYWGLFKPHRPHLTLSLIGGAKNFKMEGRKKEVFKNGLISAAKSTNALILTGGNNTGTMKLVGDAVREGQFLTQGSGSSMSRGLKLIGLTSWGYVKDNGKLINAQPKVMNRSSYNPNQEVRKGDNTPLNGDHTHFILIDDGSRYRFFGKYTEFITRFETMVRDQPPVGLGIPIVTLLLEGGRDAIRIIKDRLKEGISAVIIEGSGRAADIIAYAYRNATKNSVSGAYSLKEGHIDHLMRMLEIAYGDQFRKAEERKEGLKSIMNWTLECIRYSDILTIFDIRRETQMDKKILSALLKGHDMTLHHQLYLAMIWDRVDLAEEKIFVHGNESLDSLKKEDSLDDIMIQALLMERVNFIELLVMNGFVMKNFLTVNKLAILYNEATKTFKELHIQLKSFCGISSREIYLRQIHKLLVNLIKDHHHGYYQLHSNKTAEKNVEEKTFDEPYLELFLWAILTGKLALVDFFWKRLQAPLIAAIIAASIYSKLSLFYKNEKTASDLLLSERKQLFQERANKLVEIAFSSDVSKGISLIDRRIKRWGDRNILELSYIGHLRSFIANPSCQLVTQQAWRRGFVKLSRTTCVIGIFLPFLVWTPLVKFQPGLGDEGGDLNIFQKLYVFYKCPIVKYSGICLSFLAFLMLYSYVVLFGYRWEYQYPEVVLYLWILILIIGEIRELINEPSKRLHGKLSDYVFSVWNQFDIILSIIALTAFILRQFRQTFWYSRIVLCFNCAFYYVRVFRIYHASRNLGPKLVIFHRMVPEIITFMMLLIVFIMAYGVSSQGLVNPYRPFDWNEVSDLISGIFFLPYWQMYGELSLDMIQVHDSTDCLNPNSTISALSDVCNAPDLQEIRTSRTITPIFLAIYLLIGNVMLLNLLIAIFTSVFEEVHENSNEVWKWEMYRLVAEYDSRPGLAPPLVIIEDLWKLLKGIWKRTCRRNKENLDSYMVETTSMLKLFEKDCMDTYISHEKKKKEESFDARLALLEKKTDHLLELFEDAPDDDANWGEVVSTEKKLYKTASDVEPDSADSSSADELKKSKQLRVKFSGRAKKKHRDSPADNAGREQVRPSLSRVQTARSARGQFELQKNLEQVRDQLERMEQRRVDDLDRLEAVIDKNNRRLEEMLLKSLREK